MKLKRGFCMKKFKCYDPRFLVQTPKLLYKNAYQMRLQFRKFPSIRLNRKKKQRETAKCFLSLFLRSTFPIHGLISSQVTVKKQRAILHSDPWKLTRRPIDASTHVPYTFDCHPEYAVRDNRCEFHSKAWSRRSWTMYSVPLLFCPY